VTPPATMPLTLDDFAGLARSRRTHMLVDQDREVPSDLIDRLCELATWAPNHKRTWPWKFASCTGEARHRLGEAFVTDMIARDFGDEGKRAKTLTKYARTPAVLVVGCAPHANASLHDENRDAVAAGVQNLLLGATAAGLASFWSTPPLIDSEHALAFCGFEPDDRIVALIYLGWPVSSVEPPQRPSPDVTHLG
jgi:nitroreductase